jgi:hypothetical protein
MADDILTQAKLKECLIYDEIDGVFRQIANTGRAKSGEIAGHKHHSGYVHISIKRKRYLAHRLAWLYMHGELPTCDIDHINSVKDDNRISNLRKATRSENLQNVGLQSNNTSGIKGVRFKVDKGRWVATASHKGKNKHLGYFPTPESASNAYRLYSIENHGEFYKDASAVSREP